MRGGNSGSTGLILYDTSKKGDNAVYGYYEGDKIQLKIGRYEDLTKFKDEAEEAFKQDGDSVLRTMFKVFLEVMALIIVGFLLLPLLKGFFIMVILVVAYFPLLGLEFARSNTYKTEELQQQFRRFHGSEHIALNLKRRKKELTLDNFKNESIYNMECGTMYMGYAVFLLLVIAIVGLNISALGIIKAVLILLGAVIALLVNILLQQNPFIIFQRKAVARPTEREYLLALEVATRLEEL